MIGVAGTVKDAVGRAWNKTIGRELGLRVTTIRSYVQDILEKLDAQSKPEAVATAARHDLLIG